MRTSFNKMIRADPIETIILYAPKPRLRYQDTCVRCKPARVQITIRYPLWINDTVYVFATVIILLLLLWIYKEKKKIPHRPQKFLAARRVRNTECAVERTTCTYVQYNNFVLISANVGHEQRHLQFKTCYRQRRRFFFPREKHRSRSFAGAGCATVPLCFRSP